MQNDQTQNTCVLGLGTMGHGIAQQLAAAGLRVRAFDADAGARQSLVSRVRANLGQMQSAGLNPKDPIAETVDRITVCGSESEALAGAQFVIEAVAEDLGVKQELFRRIESLVGTDTVLASNTSSYPMTQISARMQNPGRAVVTHWFNPPHIIPVVEVVPGEKTTVETVEAACDLLQRIGKTPIRLKRELPGFLVNRVQVALFREIFDLLEQEVATPEELDLAISGSMGLRLAALGPLAIVDFAGLDVTSRVYRNLVPHLRSDQELPKRLASLVEAGRIGAKSGQGVFDYPPETVDEQIAERDRKYLGLIRLLHAVRS